MLSVDLNDPNEAEPFRRSELRGSVEISFRRSLARSRWSEALSRWSMPHAFDQLLAEFAALKPSDFDDESAGLDKLRGLTDELMAQPQPERAIPALFAVMERMPVTEMGTPGPLVQALERMRGYYERELVESVKRQSANLSVWMVNRILNGTHDSQERQIYLDLLRIARSIRQQRSL